MPRIAVIRGGRSLEREFSSRSGAHVASALQQLGHDVVELDVDERLSPALVSADASFIALHGRDGEDGTIQSILEALRRPYTGSDAFACQVCFDKVLTKGMLRRDGITTPPSFDLSAEAVRQMGAGPAVREAADHLGYPLIVKPVAQGSALGLALVREPDELSPAVMAAFNYGDRVMLESYVAGTELAVSLVGSPLRPLPPVEVRASSGIFDFDSRVSPGAVDFVVPASLPDAVLAAARDVAERAAALLGMRDLGRVDMIVSDGEPVVLEVNPCPGVTESSLLPLAVAEAGMSFEDFVRTVVDAALARSPVTA
ncbi:MAG TPA: D-alanine--D-alanine ligase [Actinomycetota bacterium]|nr:D-alanine--D-alanine ligase [Actinomycetota bacterium]